MDGINRVYGVDFSGSRDAGRGIWVAAASLDRDQRPDANRPFGWNRLVIEVAAGARISPARPAAVTRAWGRCGTLSARRGRVPLGWTSRSACRRG